MSGPVHLAAPGWLVLLAAIPILAWRHHRRRRWGALRYSRIPVEARGGWRLHLPFYARLLAWVALVLALARPQLGQTWEEIMTEGIDIQIALDVSGSMGAEDFQPRNRLAVAKEVVKGFVAGRPADRIGLVIFAGTALTRSPATSDHRVLDQLIDSLELDTLPDGTAIGVALASAAARLKASAAASRVIVLVTDGVNNAGAIDPLSAAAVCQGLGIRVYTVGVGKAARMAAPLVTRDPGGRLRRQRVMMPIAVDEDLLERIAERTGGRFFRATDGDGLRQTFAEIDALEKTPIRVLRHVRYREVFGPLALGALGLMLLPLAAAAARWTAEP